jgi:hypothetical protein
VLFKSANHGQSWEIISPDLSTNDKNKQKSSGGAVVVDNTAAEFHCTILTIAPSMVDANVIWVGTDDGNVQVTRDGGKTWTNVIKNIQGLAPNAWIPTVEASPHEAGTAFVAADHHQDNDYTAYFFKTTDYGKTWTRLNLNLPPTKTGWPHVIRQDPKNAALLYAGTELGLWVSFDAGAHWTSLRQNLPPVPVRDIQIHPRDNDLIVATHGRGLYILDDITALQNIGAALSSPVQLFDIRPATRWTVWNKDGNLGQAVWSGPNPPAGAVINYFLKSDADVTITVSDKGGKTVRTIRNAPHATGLNRSVWDLRYDGPTGAAGGRGGRGAAQPAAAQGPVEEAPGGGRFGRGNAGPLVVPGEYTVTLRSGGQELKKTVAVDMDPRVPLAAGELDAQLEAALALRDLTSRANALVDRANGLIAQLDALQQRLQRPITARAPGGSSTAPASPAGPDLAGAVEATLGAVTTLRDKDITRPYPNMGYRQYPRIREEITSLSGAVSGSPNRPTEGQALRMKELGEELDRAVAALNQIQTDQIGKINEMMKGQPFITTEIIR